MEYENFVKQNNVSYMFKSTTIGIYCKSEKEEKNLLEYLNMYGFKWISGESLINGITFGGNRIFIYNNDNWNRKQNYGVQIVDERYCKNNEIDIYNWNL